MGRARISNGTFQGKKKRHQCNKPGLAGLVLSVWGSSHRISLFILAEVFIAENNLKVRNKSYCCDRSNNVFRFWPFCSDERGSQRRGTKQAQPPTQRSHLGQSAHICSNTLRGQSPPLILSDFNRNRDIGDFEQALSHFSSPITSVTTAAITASGAPLFPNLGFFFKRNETFHRLPAFLKNHILQIAPPPLLLPFN